MNKTCVNVTILDDMLLDVEPSTFFDLTLTRTEGDQRVDIDPDRARVEIRDNESEFVYIKLLSNVWTFVHKVFSLFLCPVCCSTVLLMPLHLPEL